jgi:hypothetical protein
MTASFHIVSNLLFPNHSPFDAVYSELLLAFLNKPQINKERKGIVCHVTKVNTASRRHVIFYASEYRFFWFINIVNISLRNTTPFHVICKYVCILLMFGKVRIQLNTNNIFHTRCCSFHKLLFSKLKGNKGFVQLLCSYVPFPYKNDIGLMVITRALYRDNLSSGFSLNTSYAD